MSEPIGGIVTRAGARIDVIRIDPALLRLTLYFDVEQVRQFGLEGADQMSLLLAQSDWDRLAWLVDASQTLRPAPDAPPKEEA